MALVQISLNTILNILLYFIRINAIVFMIPFFSENTVPLTVRVLFSFSLAVFFYSIRPIDVSSYLNLSALAFCLLVLKELIIGLLFGFLAKIFFEAFIMAASLVGYQMGFGMSNLMMPGSDSQTTAFAALHRILIILIFFSLNLHYIFIEGISESFDVLKIGQFHITENLMVYLLNHTSNIFLIGVKMASPILVALMFTMAGLGILSRTVPQLNIFTLSFPVSFFIGLLLYVALIPMFPQWLYDKYTQEGQGLLAIFQLMK